MERAQTLVHPEDRSKGLFGMIQRSVTIVEDTNAIPQLGVILQRDVSYGALGRNSVDSYLGRRKQI